MPRSAMARASQRETVSSRARTRPTQGSRGDREGQHGRQRGEGPREDGRQRTAPDRMIALPRSDLRVAIHPHLLWRPTRAASRYRTFPKINRPRRPPGRHRAYWPGAGRSLRDRRELPALVRGGSSVLPRPRRPGAHHPRAACRRPPRGGQAGRDGRAGRGRPVLHHVGAAEIESLPTIDRFGRAVWLRFLLPTLLRPCIACCTSTSTRWSRTRCNRCSRRSWATRRSPQSPMFHSPEQRARIERLGVDHRKYFNSGVLLLDLDRLRAEGSFRAARAGGQSARPGPSRCRIRTS